VNVLRLPEYVVVASIDCTHAVYLSSQFRPELADQAMPASEEVSCQCRVMAQTSVREPSVLEAEGPAGPRPALVSA
jgi:hypothetical protein